MWMAGTSLDKPGHDGELVPTYALHRTRFPDAVQREAVHR